MKRLVPRDLAITRHRLSVFRRPPGIFQLCGEQRDIPAKNALTTIVEALEDQRQTETTLLSTFDDILRDPCTRYLCSVCGS